jgi:HSP20 family protein
MLMRWHPFAKELSAFDFDVDRFFQPARFAPAIDVSEEDGAIVLKAEVPGLKADELSVSVDNGVLTLSGERKLEKRENGEKLHRVERSYGAFKRSFTLPKTVDGDKIEAQLRDGVLTLRLPKREQPEKKTIEVKSLS